MLVIALDIEHTRVQNLEGGDPDHQTEGLFANLITEGDIVGPVALVQGRDITPETDDSIADDIGVGIPLNPRPYHHLTEVPVRVGPRLIVRNTEDMQATHPNEQIFRIPDSIRTQAILT